MRTAAPWRWPCLLRAAVSATESARRCDSLAAACVHVSSRAEQVLKRHRTVHSAPRFGMGRAPARPPWDSSGASALAAIRGEEAPATTPRTPRGSPARTPVATPVDRATHDKRPLDDDGRKPARNRRALVRSRPEGEIACGTQLWPEPHASPRPLKGRATPPQSEASSGDDLKLQRKGRVAAAPMAGAGYSGIFVSDATASRPASAPASPRPRASSPRSILPRGKEEEQPTPRDVYGETLRGRARAPPAEKDCDVDAKLFDRKLRRPPLAPGSRVRHTSDPSSVFDSNVPPIHCAVNPAATSTTDSSRAFVQLRGLRPGARPADGILGESATCLSAASSEQRLFPRKRAQPQPPPCGHECETPIFDRKSSPRRPTASSPG